MEGFDQCSTSSQYTPQHRTTHQAEERITLLSNEETEGFKQYRPSSSQDTVQHKRKYHVFLSFRGPDTRKSLVDHLFQNLSAAGFHVFLDSKRLIKGKNISISLEDAIRDSTVHIPIFSSDYAGSGWCLDELSHIWTCKSEYPETTTIPLFYKVEPSVVRYQTGPYAEAFKKHSAKGRYKPEKMVKWKKALRNVCDLSGWSLSLTANGYEGKLVKHVVKDLIQILKIGQMRVAKYPVALSGPMEKVIKLLEMDNDMHKLTVGILGMGGLGKTTLAKALYNNVSHQFEASCFVYNIRATASESVKGLVNLQRQILFDLVKVDKKLNNIDHGVKEMEAHLTSRKVLVILDDVDDAKQLDALVGDCYGPGSRIIITTRDAKVLKHGKIDDDKIHRMKGLSEDEGVQLFSWHAFSRACPERGYEGMTEEIVHACGGVPLSLQIVGAHLYGERENGIWSEALSKIKEEVYPSLKISYDALVPEAQQMLLEIACFFVSISNEYLDETLTFYHDFWKALGYKTVHTSLASLKQKSLISIEDSGTHCRFWMHDHLRDLGRQIVEEKSPDDPSERSRLWYKDDILNVLKHREEMPEVRGLMMTELILHSMDNVALMNNLKFLFCGGLRLQSQIKMLPKDLRYLVLSSCRMIIGSDEFFSLPPLPGSLVHIKVEECWDLRRLPPLPESLVHMKMERCSMLRELPRMSHMIKLETLRVSVCSSLYQLPELNWMQSLRELTLDYCEDLKELPPLPESLIHIKVEHCDRLKKLSSMSDMIRLETLHVSSCKSLAQLTEFNWMQSLRELTLCSCDNLEELPPLPESLVHIKVERCRKLKKLYSVSHMIKLETLHLFHCIYFVQLPELNSMQSLRELTLDCCGQLEELPPLSESLVHIKVKSCGRLKKLSSMSHMIKLETFHMSVCYWPAQLPEMNSMQSLRELTLSQCENLEELPPLPESLVHIKVEICRRLQKLSSMSHMIRLETLHVFNCDSLHQLPELKRMQSLRELILSHCENLEELPPLPKGLLKLKLDGCKNLKELPPLPKGLINLSTLGCHQLRLNASQPSSRDKGKHMT